MFLSSRAQVCLFLTGKNQHSKYACCMLVCIYLKESLTAIDSWSYFCIEIHYTVLYTIDDSVMALLLDFFLNVSKTEVIMTNPQKDTDSDSLNFYTCRPKNKTNVERWWSDEPPRLKGTSAVAPLKLPVQYPYCGLCWTTPFPKSSPAWATAASWDTTWYSFLYFS